jgi:hypothetical protein
MLSDPPLLPVPDATEPWQKVASQLDALFSALSRFAPSVAIPRESFLRHRNLLATAPKDAIEGLKADFACALRVAVASPAVRDFYRKAVWSTFSELSLPAPIKPPGGSRGAARASPTEESQEAHVIWGREILRQQELEAELAAKTKETEAALRERTKYLTEIGKSVKDLHSHINADTWSKRTLRMLADLTFVVDDVGRSRMEERALKQSRGD